MAEVTVEATAGEAAAVMAYTHGGGGRHIGHSMHIGRSMHIGTQDHIGRDHYYCRILPPSGAATARYYPYY